MQSTRFSRKGVAASAFLGTALIAGVLAGCGSSSTGTSSTSGSGAFSAAQGCTKVGVLLPETNSSPRWEAKDHPLLVAAIKKYLPNATIDYTNANGSADTQQSQAETDLTKGDCILVVAPSDANQAAAIVAKAKAQKVPVVSYDRLINSSDLAYYVSFDNVKVGQLQGQYVADHYQDFANGHATPLNTVFIKGSQTDNNAILFAQGAHSAIDPLVTSGKLKNVYETYTPNWDPPTAESEMEAALTQTNNNIQIAYVSNDDMAGTSIQALKAQHLDGKVLVTGQDATVPGLQRVLEGTQAMTVYKAITKEADATGQLVAALSKGSDTSTLASAQTKTPGGAEIKSVLETPVAIDKSNVSVVINDGFATKSDVCSGLPAGTNTNGLCS